MKRLITDIWTVVQKIVNILSSSGPNIHVRYSHNFLYVTFHISQTGEPNGTKLGRSATWMVLNILYDFCTICQILISGNFKSLLRIHICDVECYTVGNVPCVPLYLYKVCVLIHNLRTNFKIGICGKTNTLLSETANFTWLNSNSTWMIIRWSFTK